MGFFEFLRGRETSRSAQTRHKPMSRRQPLVLEGLEDRLVLSQAAMVASTPSELNAFTTQAVNQLIQQLQNNVGQITGSSTTLAPFIAQQLNSSFGTLLQPLNSIPYDNGASGGVNAQLAVQAGTAINAAQVGANEMLAVFTETLLTSGAATGSADGTILLRDGQSYNYMTVQNQLNQAFNTFRSNFSAGQSALLAGGGMVGGTTINTSADLSNFVTANVTQLVAQVQSTLSAVPDASVALTPSVIDDINGPHEGSAMLAVLNAIPYDTAASAGINAAYFSDAVVAVNTTQLAVNEMLTVSANTLLATGAATGSADGTILLRDGQSFNFQTAQNQLNQDFGTFSTNFFTEQSGLISGSGTMSTSGSGSMGGLGPGSTSSSSSGAMTDSGAMTGSGSGSGSIIGSGSSSIADAGSGSMNVRTSGI